MTVASMEVYDAFKSAGVDEDKARKAAEALGGLRETERRMDDVSKDLDRVKIDVQALKVDVTLLKWMVGANIGLTVLVLGKLLLP